MLEGCTPWPADFAAAYRRKGYWRDITLWDMLERTVSRLPDKAALVADGRRLSYRDLFQPSGRLAGRLRAAGLKPLDRVVLQLHNVPDFVTTFFALIRIGVIPVMALRPHRHTEVRHFINHAGAVAYFIPAALRDFDYRAMAEEIRPDCPTLEHVFVLGEAAEGQHSLSRLIEADDAPEAEPGPQPDPGEVALMLLSGGTTALPKLIPRTHNDYVYNCTQSGRVAGMGEDTVFLASLPLGHNYSLASPGILAAMAFGGTVVLAPGVDAGTVFPLIERERVTHTAAAVPLVTNWLNSDVPERHDLSSLRIVQNGGARLAPELRRRLEERLGCTFQEIFGTAEGLLLMTRLDDPDPVRFESSGAPVCDDDEIKVLGADDAELPDGERGELVVRGPYTIRGYYNAPQVNEAAFTADGFYRMGDIVRKQGRVIYAEGRKKDLVNRGGEKISCEEVEGYILRHPDVQNVCIVAMPDPVFGEKACAWVIPQPGKAPTLQTLCDFLLGERIAKFKLPERLELVEEFPISPAGKILRRVLRERIAEKMEQEKRGDAR